MEAHALALGTMGTLMRRTAIFATVVIVLTSPAVVHAGPSEDFSAAFYRDDQVAMKDSVNRGADVNLRINGTPMLIMAVTGGSIDRVRFLLDNGADVLAKDQSNPIGLLAIHAAASVGSIEVVDLFLARGAHVDERDAINDTPLAMAAMQNQTKMVAFLVSKGADINARNVYGMTPLHYAASSGAKEAAGLLIALGAEKNARNVEGKTAFDLANQSVDMPAEKKAAIIPLLRPMADNSGGNESQSLEHELLQCLTDVRQTDILGSQEISSGLLSVEISPSNSDHSKIIFSVRGTGHHSILDMIPQCESPKSCYGSISGMNYKLAQVGDKYNGYFIRIDREAAQYSAGEWRSNRRGRTTLVLSEHGSCNATSAKAKF